MKIRRYYGHDCDSEMGFNNGYYIDDKPVEVKDDEEAMRLCLEAMSERWNTRNADNTRSEDFSEMDNGYELITGYYDENGNDITRAAFVEAENNDKLSYRYVYVNYEVVDEEIDEPGTTTPKTHAERLEEEDEEPGDSEAGPLTSLDEIIENDMRAEGEGWE